MDDTSGSIAVVVVAADDDDTIGTEVAPTSFVADRIVTCSCIPHRIFVRESYSVAETDDIPSGRVMGISECTILEVVRSTMMRWS